MLFVLSVPSTIYSSFIFIEGKDKKFTPTLPGFYDYACGKISSRGEFEIDLIMPSGRFICLPKDLKKEVIHELPAFNKDLEIPFSVLQNQLDKLVSHGITAVHVPGAIERLTGIHLSSVTDHAIINKNCGGINDFIIFCKKANGLGLRVLIDFLPFASLTGSSRKYSGFSALQVDTEGKLVTCCVPNTDILLLNLRSAKFWKLLAQEALQLCENVEIGGFYLGEVSNWDTVLPRDLKELQRIDPDDQPH